jgi:poly(3-hydroxybutyrate) depolymerase
VLWTALGAGHTWPGSQLGLGLRLLLGRTTREIDATAEIGRFWERHRTAPAAP